MRDNVEQPPKKLDQTQHVYQTRRLLKLMGMFVIAEILLVLISVAFFAIVHGIFWGLLTLSKVWSPAYRIVSKVFAGPYARSTMPQINLTGWLILGLLLQGGFAIAFIIVGINMLFTGGFCSQSVICQILSH